MTGHTLARVLARRTAPRATATVLHPDRAHQTANAPTATADALPHQEATAEAADHRSVGEEAVCADAVVSEGCPRLPQAL